MTSSLLKNLVALTAAAGFALPALAGTYKHITLDGSFDDWAGVPAAYEDSEDPGTWADFKSVYIVNDENYLYVRFILYAPFEGFSGHNNFYFDTDNDTGTGHGAIVGAEMLIEGGAGYQEKNGGFNEGSVSGLDWAAAPSGSATDFEFRVSRSAKFDSDNTPVFNGDTIALVLEATDPQWNRADTAPDSEGLVYTFASAPTPLSANKQLVPLTGDTWKVNSQNADLGTSWTALDYDDTQSGWSDGSALFGFTPTPGAYPVAIATPLAASVKTVYLRQHFDWANTTDGAVFVVTNYLSDGAVFYLNGSEVKRVRLPEGTVAFNTPAVGGPAVKGQPEVFGISSGPLVQGDNVLAVEVHQSATEAADLVFGASLLAAVSYPAVITDSSLPADQTVVAGETATFTVTFLGSPAVSIQWYKGALAITDATNATLTLAPALAEDAGDYSAKVSNPVSSGVSSRTARLTVTQTQVVITDPAQPSNQTVNEGQPVTCTVAVNGSLPLSYQWFKDNQPIAGATNDTLSFPAVLMTDAGEYSVQVTNLFPSSITSRKAVLVVVSDKTPPRVAKVDGSPNTVIITFSEPVEEASANLASHYALSGGVKVNSAVRSGNSEQVVLSTSQQALGTLYTLTVQDVRDLFGNAITPAQTAKFRSTIVIDGIFGDWATVPLAFEDAQEDPAAGTDFKDIWITNDVHYLYIRFSLYKPGNPNTWLNNVFIDTDNDAATGYSVRGLGSELLIQQGSGYQEKNGGFNEGGINGLDWAVTPEAEGVEFECRISRDATYATDGKPVFAGDTIHVMLETEDSNYVVADTAPDSEGLAYTFATFPATELAALNVTLVGGQVKLTWDGPGVLQYASSLTNPSWTSLTTATSGYTTAPDGPARYYRLMQQ